MPCLKLSPRLLLLPMKYWFQWVEFGFVFSALVRPGRFDMQVTVPRPDVKGRTEILNWYLSKIKVDPGKSEHTIKKNPNNYIPVTMFMTGKIVPWRQSFYWQDTWSIVSQLQMQRSSPGARWDFPGRNWRTWSTRQPWRQLWTGKRWSQWRTWSLLRTRS